MMKKILPTIAFLMLVNAAFCQIYDDYIGAGNTIDVTVTSSDSQSDGFNTINANGLDLDILGSSRFLAHTTLGYNIDDIELMTETNMNDWIENQMSLEPTYHTVPTVEIIFQLYDACLAELGPACLLQFNLNTYM